jgi:hypothetical protein
MTEDASRAKHQVGGDPRASEGLPGSDLPARPATALQAGRPVVLEVRPCLRPSC